jgi:hypothetical protein
LFVVMPRSFTKTKRKKSVLEERFVEAAGSKAMCDNSPACACRFTQFGATPSWRFRYRPRAAGLGFSSNSGVTVFGCMRPGDYHLVPAGYADRDGTGSKNALGTEAPKGIIKLS